MLTRSQHPLPAMRVSFLFLLLTLMIGCTGKSGSENTARAFYYWQTSLNDFNWNDSTYQALKVRKVFYRFFDVAWSTEASAPIPVSPLTAYWTNWMPQTEIVPVVFITNETFKKLDKPGAAKLAKQVHGLVLKRLAFIINLDYTEYYKTNYWEQNPYQVRSKDFNEIAKHDSLFQARMEIFKEIQFDCDWTSSTKENYFTFLEESKKLFRQQVVTSTVRLYQYKYPQKAGVPPVERGMLMCYNAGDVTKTQTVNSIFDKKEILSYLKGADYPLPLDYALPIFQWALLYQQNKLMAILPASLPEDYAQFLLAEDETHFRVKEDFVYGHTAESILVRAGNTLRIESPDLKDVEALAEWLGEHKNNPQALLTLYHLNTYDLQKHPKAIESIFNSF